MKLTDSRNEPNEEFRMHYTSKNYLTIAVGFVMVLIGFFVMAGDTDIYSFRHTTLPVLIILSGFVVTGIGIMLKSKTDKSDDSKITEA